MRAFSIGTAVLWVVAFVAPAQASVILVEFNFNGNTAAPSIVDSNVSTTNFLAGAGLSSVTLANDEISAVGWHNQASAAEAIGANNFFQFTVTAAPGLQLNLDEIRFDERRGSSGPVSFQVRVNNTLVSTPLTSTTTMTPRVVDLSGFNGLSSAVIQLVAWDASNNGVNAQWLLDNVQLSGTAVPEPSGLALATLLLPAVLIGRRMRRKAGEQVQEEQQSTDVEASLAV